MKIHRIAALLLRHWYVTINGIDRLFDLFFWPVFSLFLWGFTSIYIDSLGSSGFVVGIFIGGLMLWSIFDRAQKDVSIYIIQDFWDRSVYNLYVTPMKESELFASVALFGVIRTCISFGITALLALVGYRFNIFSVGMFNIALFSIPLFIFGWAAGIFIAGLIFRYGARISIITWSIPFFIQPVAAVFYPISILPVSLQKMSLALPLVYVFEGFRAAMDNTFLPLPFLWAILLSFFYLVVCYAAFVWFVRRSRKTGFLSKQ